MEEYNNLMKMKQMEYERYMTIIENRGFLNVDNDISLNICENLGHNKYFSYDHTTKKKTYLNKEHVDIAKELAQAGYDQEAYKLLKQGSRYFQRAIETEKKLANLSEKMGQSRMKLITPLFMSDKEFIDYWEKQNELNMVNTYPIEGDIYTNKHEHVRSKSEKIIADTLLYYGVPYKYESCLKVGKGYVFPDFKVLNVKARKEIIWEHFGRLGDEVYMIKNQNKLENYMLNGYMLGDRLITTFEGDKPINTNLVNMIIETYFL